MKDIFSEVKSILDNAKQLTENGAVGYQTSGKALLDMNFKISSYRNVDENTILKDFIKALAEDPVLATKWVFYVGDVREGQGERRLFRILIKYLLSARQDLIKYVGEYNRFDSLFVLFGTDAEDAMVQFVQKQLAEDMTNCKNGKPISLLAKWMPSINTSSEATKALARKFVEKLGTTDRQYRKMLSKLRAHSEVIEQKLCAGEWGKVDYETVPSKANLKYKNAFLKNDETRRREFLAALTKGEAKINASVSFPHEIVWKYVKENYHSHRDEALEGMWKNLKNYNLDKPIIVVRDGSGSMGVTVDRNGGTRAIDVATALAIYFAERNKGPYANKFITFSARPKLIDLGNLPTLAGKLQRTYSEDECANTNIEAVFDLLLDAAIKGGAKADEIPTVLVLSDMEFDSATRPCWGEKFTPFSKALFEQIGARWKRAGYVLPKLVFWNINGRTNTVPVQENDAGVALVSGFSQNNTKMVMSNKLDPYEILKEELLSPRYAVIK